METKVGAIGVTEKELREIEEGTSEFPKAPLAYQFELGNDKNLQTSMLYLHKHYKIKAGMQNQTMFGVRYFVSSKKT